MAVRVSLITGSVREPENIGNLMVDLLFLDLLLYNAV